MMDAHFDEHVTEQNTFAPPANELPLDFSPYPPVSGGACSSGYIASAIWGGTCQYYLTSDGTEATWLPDYPYPCSMYDYAWDYCRTGCIHPGADISMAEGTPLYAAEGGEVIRAGYTGYYKPYEIRIRNSSGHEHI